MTLWGSGWWLAALAALGPSGPKPVRLGIDVLLTDSAGLIRDRRVGLVTNRAAVDRDGVSVVDRLRAAGVRLVALFSPEHGFRGAAAPGESVAFATDSATGLPIYSLYGRTTRPTAAMLENVDLLLVDLPDVGARYFSYLATTIEVLRGATAAGRRVVVLDRPDPIGGRVQGNVLLPSHRSFIGSLAVPMRYGMTLGELARLADADLGLRADFVVVPAAGWRRDDDAIDLGLPFVPPSPNLTERESLWHYPGTCLFEGTALSIGRGTDSPFRQIGAPWLDRSRVLATVRAAKLAGVAFDTVTFTPRTPGDGKLADVAVPGIRLRMTDRHRYDPILTSLTLLAAVRRAHPDRIAIDSAHFDRLAGGPALRHAILDGVDPRRIVAGWKAELARFAIRRRPFLLYR